MCCDLGEEVQGVEEVQVLLAVLRVCRVEQRPAFAGPMADLLQLFIEIAGPSMYSVKLRRGAAVEDAHGVVAAEAGMPPGKHGARATTIDELLGHQQRNQPAAQQFGHRLEAPEGYEGAGVIEPTFQDDGVMRVPAQHVTQWGAAGRQPGGSVCR